MVLCECPCGYHVDSKEHLQFHYYDIMREIEQQRETEPEIHDMEDN